ncbi:YfiR family protein [Altererythrobacter sp. CC-YST694]|uniref:YfiR family protein n=1 Tax=Altererythrobacter sp. CC-YST694 TaxID=2755038 RepID=UPI001D01AE0A|nr:YfiR family protein [Altererythrobacter sp. CC-YST694]MCB5423880.1 YfiR family protein [Altererythrobacter sp. CC-YST694]
MLLGAVFGNSVTALANSPQPGIGAPAQPEAKGVATATARIVRAILEYTRWPKPIDPVEVCIVGTASMGAAIETISLSDGRQVAVRHLARDGFASSSGCDAYYLGALDAGAMRQWISRAHGGPVVTIAERDPQCRSEAMFCMVYGPNTVSFRLNVDAVSRSGVRVDPRVLRIAKDR